MSRTTRQHRIAAAAATRRWRQRQAKGIRLVTVEVSEAKLAQLVAERLVPAAAIENSVRLGAAFSQIIDQGTVFSAPVMDHEQRQTRGRQGCEPRDAITDCSGTHDGTHDGHAQVEHPDYPGRDARGRWLKGACGCQGRQGCGNGPSSGPTLDGKRTESAFGKQLGPKVVAIATTLTGMRDPLDRRSVKSSPLRRRTPPGLLPAREMARTHTFAVTGPSTLPSFPDDAAQRRFDFALGLVSVSQAPLQKRVACLAKLVC